MKNKKAQIQMGETIFVVIIIILLILLGMVFLFDHEKQTAERKQDEFFELDSVAQAQLIANLPELSDSSFGVKEQMSFDTLKLSAFENLTNKHIDLTRQYYFTKLGNINITIQQIYPKVNGEIKTWELYINNFSVEGDETRVTIGRPMMLPVSLYDPIADERYFGLLYITHYRKG